jgi:hypothetical protein
MVGDVRRSARLRVVAAADHLSIHPVEIVELSLSELRVSTRAEYSLHNNGVPYHSDSSINSLRRFDARPAHLALAGSGPVCGRVC